MLGPFIHWCLPRDQPGCGRLHAHAPVAAFVSLYVTVHCCVFAVPQNALLCLCMFCCEQRFLAQPGIPVETAVRVYRRYLQLEPTHAEEFIAYLKQKVRGKAGWGWVGLAGLSVVNALAHSMVHFQTCPDMLTLESRVQRYCLYCAAAGLLICCSRVLLPHPMRQCFHCSYSCSHLDAGQAPYSTHMAGGDGVQV